MNKLELEKIIRELLDTFLLAGNEAKKISEKGVKIKIKPDKTPVTDGDIKVDQLLRGKIEKLTPNIPIISEETVNLKIANKHETFWLIDPIDGTKDYIKKKDEYTLNAALVINFKVEAGIVYAPAKDRLFFTFDKNQSFEISHGETKKLNCSKKNVGEILALAHSGAVPNEILKIYEENKATKIIKMSSSLKFCVMAAGEADIYAAKSRAFEWDIAAGHIVLENAGGLVTTLSGDKFLYGKKDYKNLPILVRRAKNLGE